MDVQNLIEKRRAAVWLDGSAGDFEAFRALVEGETNPEDWPFAASIEGKIPIYDGARVRAEADDPQALLAEWNTVFDQGPGVIVIRGGMADLDVVDQATSIFDAIIAEASGE